MSSLLGLLSGLWGNVGPGLLLALVFPFLVGALALVVVEGFRRVRAQE